MGRYSGCRTGLLRHNTKAQAEAALKALKVAFPELRFEGVKCCDRCHYGWHVHVKGSRGRIERKIGKGKI